MMGSRGNVLFFLLLFMTGVAGAILVAEERRVRQWPARAESFQRLVGGLGFGPELDLSSCIFGFDPRLDGGRSTDYGSIPGAACFSPCLEDSVFFYPPPERRFQRLDAKNDALPP